MNWHNFLDGRLSWVTYRGKLYIGRYVGKVKYNYTHEEYMMLVKTGAGYRWFRKSKIFTILPTTLWEKVKFWVNPKLFAVDLYDLDPE